MKIFLFSYLMWVAYTYGEMGDGPVRCQQSGDDARSLRAGAYLQVHGGGGGVGGAACCSLTPRPPCTVASATCP